MRPLRYSINITLDGCCDHRAGQPDAELHQYAADTLAAADALLFGRVTYGLMEDGWRKVAETGIQAEWMADWMLPFARVIQHKPKYVVSDSLPAVDWNAELVRGPALEATVRRLKAEPGNGLYVGGVTLPLALAELGLIDEYEFIVQPRIAGHGPTPFSGLSRYVDLALAGRRDFACGAVALRYTVRG